MSDCPALVQVFEDNVELSKRLCSFVKDRYDEAVESHGKFHIAVSGGSLPKFMKGLSKRQDIDWTKWWVYFCDERYVSSGDPDSNYGALKQVLLDDISIPESQILKINCDVSVEEAAKQYEQEMKERLPSLALDLALCGMGPDGHTCSLFPGHSLLKEESVHIAPITDSPKPPPKRITMTYPLLRKCLQIVFVVTGESKVAMVVSSLHESPEDRPPAGQVRPDSGKLFWFLDSKAAAGLPDRGPTPSLI